MANSNAVNYATVPMSESPFHVGIEEETFFSDGSATPIRHVKWYQVYTDSERLFLVCAEKPELAIKQTEDAIAHLQNALIELRRQIDQDKEN